jgi:hypothetical protein
LELPHEALPQPVNAPDPDYPLHYYVRDAVIPIERPENDVPSDRVPRIGVYATNNGGNQWIRAGYYGLGQRQFLLASARDGEYGIRFVGPGIRESLTERVLPHRIYHVDRTAPRVNVIVSPLLSDYSPGTTVTVTWAVEDRNPDPMPARMAVCWGWENPDLLEYHPASSEGEGGPSEIERSHSRLWRPFEQVLPKAGSIEFAIPEPARGEGFQFQVRAKDRAGNYGVGYSHVLYVPETDPIPEEIEPEKLSPTPISVTLDESNWTPPPIKQKPIETVPQQPIEVRSHRPSHPLIEVAGPVEQPPVKPQLSGPRRTMGSTRSDHRSHPDRQALPDANGGIRRTEARDRNATEAVPGLPPSDRAALLNALIRQKLAQAAHSDTADEAEASSSERPDTLTSQPADVDSDVDTDRNESASSD